jgi:hypothetical protein
MTRALEEFLAALPPSLDRITAKQLKGLVEALTHIPENRSTRIEIEQQGHRWLMIVDLTEL